MPVYCAIDAGSNALRIAIASANNGKAPQIIYSGREAIRIGADVFATGRISAATIEKCVMAFCGFQQLINHYGAQNVQAVGTSALREAENAGEFISVIEQHSGIKINVISGLEEARLLCLALGEKIPVSGRNVVMLDIGGGSVQTAFKSDTDIFSFESYPVGAVRLMQLYGKTADKDEYARKIRHYLKLNLKIMKTAAAIDICFAAGGNIEVMGELKKHFFSGGAGDSISLAELKFISGKLQQMSYVKLISELSLHPDRADVIFPAVLTLEYILDGFGLKSVIIPHVTLKEGILAEMAEKE